MIHHLKWSISNHSFHAAKSSFKVVIDKMQRWKSESSGLINFKVESKESISHRLDLHVTDTNNRDTKMWLEDKKLPEMSFVIESKPEGSTSECGEEELDGVKPWHCVGQATLRRMTEED